MSVFFFDNCLAERLVRMLAAYDGENTIVHLKDEFAENTQDVDFIPELARRDPRPVYLTADLRQRRDRAERAALAESGLTVVFFKNGFNSLPMHDQAVKTLKLWPAIVEATTRARQPTAFEITPAGTKVDRVGLTRELGR